jgi:hypothetical protein
MSDATRADESWRQFPCIETDWWRDQDGYGQRYVLGSAAGGRNPKYLRHHRVALEEKLGRPIRPGMFACHHCDNPPCVNPEHLYEGTPADNTRDMMTRGRQVLAGMGLGIGKRGSALSDDEKAEIIRRYLAGGVTQRALGDEFRVDQVTISNIIKRVVPQPADVPPGRRRGSWHHKAKLTEDDVRAIRQRRANGEKRRVIPRDYDISPDNFNQIISRATWKWLD